jgi:aspartate/tyrosine/aromatic aminotransferase
MKSFSKDTPPKEGDRSCHDSNRNFFVTKTRCRLPKKTRVWIPKRLWSLEYRIIDTTGLGIAEIRFYQNEFPRGNCHESKHYHIQKSCEQSNEAVDIIIIID